MFRTRTKCIPYDERNRQKKGLPERKQLTFCICLELKAYLDLHTQRCVGKTEPPSTALWERQVDLQSHSRMDGIHPWEGSTDEWVGYRSGAQRIYLMLSRIFQVSADISFCSDSLNSFPVLATEAVRSLVLPLTVCFFWTQYSKKEIWAYGAPPP